MITVTFDEVENNGMTIKEMTVEGHANYAEHGKDIVCASVSALAFALVGYVENYCPLYAVVMNDDGGYIKTRVYDASSDDDTAFKMALLGMLQVEKAFPDYVKVKHNKKI